MKLTSKIILVTIFLFVKSNLLFSKVINSDEAQKAGEVFLNWRYSEIKNDEIAKIKLYKTISEKNIAVIYIYNAEPEGFIIISADDKVVPILAYSTDKTFDDLNTPFAMKEWLEWTKQQIINTRQENLNSTQEIKKSWESLLSGNINYLSTNKGEKSVEPLITSTWDQGSYYNELCPPDNFGPGGHVWAGCVATSMSQIMHYYKHPLQGYGSSSYTHSTYGYQYADYGNTTYEWTAMPNIINSSNLHIASLMYHCGVSVEMNYSTSGSGASLSNAAYAFRNYFRYSNTVKHYEKYNYFYSWENLLKSNLDAGNPVLYAGFEPDDGSGHAFIIDGYDATNYFHFNWGWSGTHNGYFYLDNLNPGSHDFTAWQQAVVNIYPFSGYPSLCSGTQSFSYTSGLFDDGSGPVDKYAENSDCYWLINPDNVDKINLKFLYFNTEQNNDKVIIYDGSDINATVLATFSGNTLPSAVSSTGGAMLVRFITDNSVNYKGWLAEYTSEKKAPCDGTVELTEPFGVFSDGSLDNDYDNNLNCKWHIKPPNAASITLSFTDFSTEPIYDYVRIVDPTQSPALTLKTHSGFSVPPDFTYSGSELLVLFKTGPSTTYKGWNAEYFSSQTNINNYSNNDINISVYPNPASNYIYLVYNSKSDNELQINITDISGRRIKQINYSVICGINKILLSTEDLNSGIYLINVNNKDFSVIRKLIIQ